STRRQSLSDSRGGRPRRVGPASVTRPPWRHLADQRLTFWGEVPSRRATSAWERPCSNSRPARRRRCLAALAPRALEGDVPGRVPAVLVVLVAMSITLHSRHIPNSESHHSTRLCSSAPAGQQVEHHQPDNHQDKEDEQVPNDVHRNSSKTHG